MNGRLTDVKDKHGQLGIWDARAPVDDAEKEDHDVDPDQRESGKYWRLQVHWPATAQSSISCIKFDPIDAHSVRHKQLAHHSYSPSPLFIVGIYECV
jgi:hypothetical protein